MRFRRLPAAVPLLLTVVAVVLSAGTACDVRVRVGQDPDPIELPEGREAVELRVIEGAGGSVLVLIPVLIQGQGPYFFALDTGASQTLLDSSLVEELGLEISGQVGPVTGIVGATTADQVRLESWSIGEVELPATDVLGLEMMASGAGQAEFRGLLGADILRRFGIVTLDFEREVLILGE